MSQPSKKVQPTANPSGEQRRMHSGSVPGVGSMGVPTTSTGSHVTNLDTLRKVAEAATPGPWTLEYENSDDWEAGINDGDYPHTIHGPRNCSFDNWTDKSKIQDYLNRVTEISEMVDEDAEFIATFDPTTVLALITRLEQAEAQIARVREVVHEYDPDCLTCMCNSDGDCCKCTVADFQEALDGDTRG